MIGPFAGAFISSGPNSLMGFLHTTHLDASLGSYTKSGSTGY